MCSTDHGMRLRIKVGLNQSRTWSTTTVSVHNQHIKRKKWHLHGVKTGGHSLIRDPHSGKWRVLWPPGPPQDRRHWLKTSSVICSRPNSSVGTQSFFLLLKRSSHFEDDCISSRCGALYVTLVGQWVFSQCHVHVAPSRVTSNHVLESLLSIKTGSLHNVSQHRRSSHGHR